MIDLPYLTLFCRLRALLLALPCLVLNLNLPASPLPPPPAQSAGYKILTYSGKFSRETVDLNSTENSGFQWYRFHFFGNKLNSPPDTLFNNDGSITLGSEAGESLVSASPATSNDRWVGTAFGGGAYFEAELRFDPRNTIDSKVPKAWPSFWGMAIEHLANLVGEQWQGAPTGYSHFIEIDFLEYDVWNFSPHNYYGGAIHDWFGQWKLTCPGQAYCRVSNIGGSNGIFDNFIVKTPKSTDFTRYHKFGFLWVPATKSSSGYGQYFFDGKPTNDLVFWSKFDNQQPPPGHFPWTFGIIDQQHLALIIGSGSHQPTTIRSVQAWQASAAANIVH